MGGNVHGMALDLVRAFGRDTVSFQALEEGVRMWSDGGHGVVPYADTGSAWVAAGSPLAPQNRLRPLARAFIRAAKAKGRRACFVGIENPLDPEGMLRPIRIGEQPVWEPARWAETVAASRNIKEQIRRARAKKLEVRRLAPHETEPAAGGVRDQIEALAQRWLDTRGGPPLRFLLDLQLFSNPGERRLFAAMHQGELMALLSAVPVYGRGGWFFEDILRDPRSPNGTVELLIDTAMRQLAEEGAKRVTMGLVPLAGNVQWWLRAFRLVRVPLYDFDGLRRFRQKLLPHAWEPVFIGAPWEQTEFISVWDVLSAVTGGSPIAWGVAALKQSVSAPSR